MTVDQEDDSILLSYAEAERAVASFVAVQESGFGTKRTSKWCGAMSAFGGKADVSNGVEHSQISRVMAIRPHPFSRSWARTHTRAGSAT